MRFINKSQYPDDEVRRLIEFAAKGVNLDRVLIVLKDLKRGAYGGLAHDGVNLTSPGMKMKTVDRTITLRLGPPEKFPTSNEIFEFEPFPDTDGKYHIKGSHGYGGKRSPIIKMETWQEGLITLAAHEARHIYQFKHRKRGSEVDAERFAAKRLEAFRAQSCNSN